MKFQNPILKFVRTDGQMNKPKAICPFNFSKVCGITRYKIELKCRIQKVLSEEVELAIICHKFQCIHHHLYL